MNFCQNQQHERGRWLPYQLCWALNEPQAGFVFNVLIEEQGAWGPGRLGREASNLNPRGPRDTSPCLIFAVPSTGLQAGTQLPRRSTREQHLKVGSTA